MSEGNYVATCLVTDWDSGINSPVKVGIRKTEKGLMFDCPFNWSEEKRKECFLPDCEMYFDPPLKYKRRRGE